MKIEYFGLKHKCNICNSHINEFLPAGGKERIFKEEKMIGAGYRENVVCPICGSTDRTRFLHFVLKKYTEIYKNNYSILHFAPELGIEEKLRKNMHSNYITGDIVQGKADHVVDVEDICFPDNCFDYVICNYVLQYVDDEKALFEMKRVLKGNGKIILSVPISSINKHQITFDPPQKIGRSYYKRFYGRDFYKRLKNETGLKVKQIRCKGNKIANYYGFITDDTIFILEK